jgi:phosphoglycerate dehydrogenase-like enzyme
MGSKPKAPKPTAADEAMIVRQGLQLDEEIAKNEKRLKAVTRGGLGVKSLLGTKAESKAKEVSSGAYGPDKTKNTRVNLLKPTYLRNR